VSLLRPTVTVQNGNPKLLERLSQLTCTRRAGVHKHSRKKSSQVGRGSRSVAESWLRRIGSARMRRRFYRL
jgi:hypothetical protein